MSFRSMRKCIVLLAVTPSLYLAACTSDTNSTAISADTTTWSDICLNTNCDPLEPQPDTTETPDESFKRPDGPFRDVRGIALSQDGGLWLATGGGLANLNLHTGEWLVYSTETSQIRNDQLAAVAADESHVWVSYGTNSCVETNTLGCGVSRYTISEDTWTHFDEKSIN